jgi:hypothetical protein
LHRRKRSSLDAVVFAHPLLSSAFLHSVAFFGICSTCLSTGPASRVSHPPHSPTPPPAQFTDNSLPRLLVVICEAYALRRGGGGVSSSTRKEVIVQLSDAWEPPRQEGGILELLRSRTRTRRRRRKRYRVMSGLQKIFVSLHAAINGERHHGTRG